MEWGSKDDRPNIIIISLNIIIYTIYLAFIIVQIISNLIPFRNLNLMFALGIVVRTLVTAINSTVAGDHDDSDADHDDQSDDDHHHGD